MPLEEWKVCRLSHPAHPHALSSRRSRRTRNNACFACSDHETRVVMDTFHYQCTTCDVEFHIDCHKSPRKMTHPYHPQHPLILSEVNLEVGIIYDQHIKIYGTSFTIKVCDDDKEFIAPSSSIPYHGNIHNNCSWCETMNPYLLFYRCSMCNFCLCLPCSKNFPLPSITNPKSHHHPLIFLPRPLLHPCDACGVVKQSEPSYACFQCNYVVHKSCIYLPRVIKLTRHPHRLLYTPFLASTIPSCRLCYKIVDIKYGHYSCNHGDCSYIAHSKCATHENVWDGSELEWEPEEFGETEDVEPFKKVGDDLIKYFSHEHHLKLEKYDGVRDAGKQCEACILHIDSRSFYSCMQCDFVLHEVCANLPLKLDHALHNHPIFLDTGPIAKNHPIYCSVCGQHFSGFRYKCSQENCLTGRHRMFQIDFRCILVPDYFTHKSHEHPLFIPIAAGREAKNICKGCMHKCRSNYLQCSLCEFAMCYKCATLPDELHYKYDAFPLYLCYGEISDETYWCELCEGKLDLREWFYTSKKPYITIHLRCVLGTSFYMKPDYTFYIENFKLEVCVNGSNTRPICHGCDSRCTNSIYFKVRNERIICNERIMCSMECNYKLK